MPRQHKINKERAQRVENALRHSDYWDHGESYALADLIGDARHLCDRMGWDFDEVLQSAENHYECETQPDDLEQDARRLHRRGDYPIISPRSITIMWGESPEADQDPVTYTFGSQAELDAFLKGIEEMDGWAGWHVIEEGTVWCRDCREVMLADANGNCASCHEEEPANAPV